MSSDLVNKQVLITVAVPVYNREDCIAKCIDSVINQSLLPFELVIVDDGSSDNTNLIIREYANRYDWIKPYKLELNSGVNTARNECVSKTNGNYILWLDSDDELVVSAIESVFIELNKGTKSPKIFQHYMFLVSDRSSEFSRFPIYTEYVYNQWLCGDVSGDFVHVMQLELLKLFPFMENFKASEGLTFLHIHKYTKVQLFVNKLVTERDRGRSDSLTNSAYLVNHENIVETYNYLNYFLIHFGGDLSDLKKSSYQKLVLKMIILGVSINQETLTSNFLKENRHTTLYIINKLLKNIRASRLIFYMISNYSKWKNKL